MMVNGKLIKNMVKEYIDGLMANIMMENGKMMKRMVMELFINLMETNSEDNL